MTTQNIENEKFSLRKRLKSFSYAFNGLKILINEEHNSRIHIAVAVLVIIAGFGFKISSIEWLAVVLCIGFVFVLEIINSALENLCDFVSPERNETIKKVKDLSAAAVLISAITSVIIGVIIFLPKINLLIKKII
ncbi:MAG: diacylglycerol kinase family protein [Prevotellaceae bacterium]|jgi:diacylglycerol kinase|nr:diacylglycerol kinase family protein [Prevotellaceae bacterium]